MRWLWVMLLAGGAQAEMLGYRGDGSGVFPNAKPPTTGPAVKWETPLPSWGHGSPVAVGNRLFVMVEPWPGHYFPELLCLDAATGKVLWQRALDHTVGMAGREQILKDWQEAFDDLAKRKQLIHAKDGKTAYEAAGYEFNARWSKLEIADAAKRKAFEEKLKRLRTKAGVGFDTWYYGCGVSINCVGNAYATPISDGTAVYTATGFGGFCRFDFDGKLAWAKFHPGVNGEYCRNGRSPLLYRGLLLADIGGRVRAMDKETGELKWSHDVDDETIMTPAIITVGGTDVLLCYNKKAFRLPDGTPLKVEGGTDFGATTIVKHDERDVVFSTGGGEHGGWEKKGACATPPPSCVRYRLAGDKLVGEVRWSGVNGEKVNTHTGITYDAGKLFHCGGLILDALTGKVLAGKASKKGGGAVPDTHHLLLVGNGHVFGLNRLGGKTGNQAKLSWHDLAGKAVGSLTLTRTPHTPEQRAMLLACSADEEWGGFANGCTFTIGGDHIYVRSLLNLICLGAR